MSTHQEIPVAEVRANFGDIISRTSYGGERFIVVRYGKPAAAIISAEDLARFEALEDEVDAAALREAIATDDGERLDFNTVARDLGLDNE